MLNIEILNFEKCGGLIPAIIKDIKTKNLLMLGFMNREALELTIKNKRVTFYSRSKSRLWTKGETSGHYLLVNEIETDCDNDTLLIKVTPTGNTCHLDNYSCFMSENNKNDDFLAFLFEFIKNRKIVMPEGSYTTKLFQEGLDRIIQKVGEESIEVIIAAKNKSETEVVNEVSDLMYHLFVMLTELNIEFQQIILNLHKRHK